MTREKDFKRLVRARMLKTGEAYTAARARILSKPVPTITRAAPQPPKDYAALAGISDRAIKENTGCTWDRWVPMLDRLGAAEMRHGEIAALVSRKFKVGDWWTQTVTVGYERIKGRRAIGQRLDGHRSLLLISPARDGVGRANPTPRRPGRRSSTSWRSSFRPRELYPR